MVAAVEWSALELAGAFVVGALIGGIAVIRVMRYLFDYFARRGDK
jgi:uncharacterized membrane protein